MADQMAERPAAAAAPMAQEAFSDYHLYTLGRKTTINNNETKQVSMLSGTRFPVQKRYVVNGNRFYYHNGPRPGAPVKDAVEVFYQFKNEEKGGLGMPMPAGTVRVYQSDSNGGVHFVGEDRIPHTPKDEMLHLKIGNAFDVVCERSQVDFKRSRPMSTKSNTRLRSAIKDDADYRRGERGGRRSHLAHAELDP